MESDLVIDCRRKQSDSENMTALSVFERTTVKLPQCDRCDMTAWAVTPSGPRCEEHTLEELRDAIAKDECDWVPRKLRRRR